MCGYDYQSDRFECGIEPPPDPRPSWTLFWLFVIVVSILSLTFGN